ARGWRTLRRRAQRLERRTEASGRAGGASRGLHAGRSAGGAVDRGGGPVEAPRQHRAVALPRRPQAAAGVGRFLQRAVAAVGRLGQRGVRLEQLFERAEGPRVNADGGVSADEAVVPRLVLEAGLLLVPLWVAGNEPQLEGVVGQPGGRPQSRV